jgi:hypothetical protein
MSGVRYTYSRLLQDRRSQVIELLERRACAIQAEALRMPVPEPACDHFAPQKVPSHGPLECVS